MLIGLLWTCLSQLTGEGIHRPSPTEPVKPTMGPVTNSASHFLYWISSAVGNRTIEVSLSCQPAHGELGAHCSSTPRQQRWFVPLLGWRALFPVGNSNCSDHQVFHPQRCRSGKCTGSGLHPGGFLHFGFRSCVPFYSGHGAWPYLAKESLLPTSRPGIRVREPALLWRSICRCCGFPACSLPFSALYISFPSPVCHRFIPNIAAAIAMSAAIEPFSFWLNCLGHAVS